MICFLTTLANELHKAGIRRALCSPKIRIVPASRNLEERAHCCYGIFILISFNRCKFDLWSHILPAAWRKDRYSSTSRSSSRIRRAIACGSVIGCLRERPFLFDGADGFACFRLNRQMQFLICIMSKLSASAISFRVCPVSRIWRMMCSIDWISVHLLVMPPLS